MTYTLGELAHRLGAELRGPAELVIHGLAAVDQATSRDLSFIAQKKYARLAASSQAAAFIVSPEWAGLGRPCLVVDHPYLAYARAAALFAPSPWRWPGISDRAYLGEGVSLGADVSVAPLAFIGDRVRLGDRVTIGPGCVLGQEVEIGPDSYLYPNVTILDRCRVGARVTIHSGTVLGADGFGYVPLPEGHHKIPQLGIVVIEDDVEIGANCTIDRAALGETRIGRGTKIDNLVQVGHNVVVGEHSIFVAQVGIAGSTKVGRRVVMGGQAGVVGHITIGDGAQLGAKAGVNHSIGPGQVVLGVPARPYKEFLAINAVTGKLPEMHRRLKKLEQQIAALLPKEAVETES
jgi:UDP-3-O-[3-hydroxymyristoyl] glucosamine N-acyltransferase